MRISDIRGGGGCPRGHKRQICQVLHMVIPKYNNRPFIIIKVSSDAIFGEAATLTRSLPRDVYIRRQNDHPGGQGRIYTSHLNFVSTHLSKPGHRRGCCCMSPRCLRRQFVVRCLLFWAFFIEKTVLLCFARFLSKWRETALLWMFPDATSCTSCTFDGFRYDGERGESWFPLVESEGDEWRWIFAGRGN